VTEREEGRETETNRTAARNLDQSFISLIAIHFLGMCEGEKEGKINVK
jgi:hypothetical protein